MNDVWTKDQDAELLRLRVSERLPMDRVAQVVGRPVSACFTRFYKISGTVLHPKSPLDDAGREYLRAAFAQGRSASEMATHLGREVSLVQYYLGAMGLRRGLTKAWTDSDDALLREVFSRLSEEDALDEVCGATGRLRGQVTRRMATLRSADAKARTRVEAVEGRSCAGGGGRRAWIDRVDQDLRAAVADQVRARGEAKDLALRFGVSVDLVTKIAKADGIPFAKGWSADEVAVLTAMAGRYATQADVVEAARPLLPNRKPAAILAKVKTLRLAVTGVSKAEARRVQVKARPAARLVARPAARPAASVASSPSASRAGAAAPVRRMSSTPATRAKVAPGGDDMAKLMAEFAAKGRQVQRVGDDGVVTALRRRGHTVVGDGDGYRVNGRVFLADVGSLARFASSLGINV